MKTQDSGWKNDITNIAFFLLTFSDETMTVKVNKERGKEGIKCQ